MMQIRAKNLTLNLRKNRSCLEKGRDGSGAGSHEIHTMEGDMMMMMMMMEDESEDNSRGRLNKIQYVDNQHWNGISSISQQRSRNE